MRSSRHLGLFSLKKRRLWRNFITLYNCLKRGCSKVGVDFFSHATSGRTKEEISHVRAGSGFSLKVWLGIGTGCPRN